MKTIKMGFSVMALISLLVTAQSIGQSSPTLQLLSAQHAETLFNYEVQRLGMGKDKAGQPVLTAQIGLKVQERQQQKMNMSFILVFYRNGKPFHRSPFNVFANGAITCAVTCAGKCPSIFGDGVCSGCGCDYSNAISIPLAKPQKGEILSVRLVPARGALKDRNEKDNEKRIKL